MDIYEANSKDLHLFLDRCMINGDFKKSAGIESEYGLNVFITDMLKNPSFMIFENNDPIGYISFQSKEKANEFEVSLYIDELCRNQGFGTAALDILGSSLLNCLSYKEKSYHANALSATLSSDHTAMIKVLENNGFYRCEEGIGSESMCRYAKYEDDIINGTAF